MFVCVHAKEVKEQLIKCRIINLQDLTHVQLHVTHLLLLSPPGQRKGTNYNILPTHAPSPHLSMKHLKSGCSPGRLI